MRLKTMQKVLTFIMALTLMLQVFTVTGLATGKLAPDTAIQNLQIENLKNPIGIDETAPDFSWQMLSETRGQKQTAYQIMMSDSPQKLAAGEYIWDSGRVASDQSHSIPYSGGSALKAATRYFWQVRVWDKNGESILSAEEAFFETGLMESSPLGDVQWLTKGKQPVELVNTVFTFEADVRINVDAAGLMFGKQDSNNYLFWQIKAMNGKTQIVPHRYDNGSWTFPGTVDITSKFPPEDIIGKTIHVRLEVNNGKVDTFFNDQHVCTTNVTPFNVGGIGLRLSNNGGVQENADFDNIKVTLGDGTLYFAEDFSDPANPKFEGGTFTEDGMYNVIGKVLDAKTGVSFRLEEDIRLNKVSAGLLFGTQDQDNFFMWQFNAEGSEILVRPHVYANAQWQILSGGSLAGKFTKDEIMGQVMHVRLEVIGGSVKTYINDVYICVTSLGDFPIGGVGFRQSGSENADFDNIKLTLPDGTISFEEDFSDPNNLPFSGGTITPDGMYNVTGKTILTEDLINSEVPAPMFRKEFSSGGKIIKSARLYATSAGTYEAYINGQKADDSYLNPGRTKSTVRTMYQTFDVTDLLNQGNNAIGVILGHGWFNRAKMSYGGTLGFAGKLVVNYADGSQDVIKTDDSWKFYGNGPVRDDDIFNGEKYDATKEQAGWSNPGFEANKLGWTDPVIKTRQQLNVGTIVAQKGPLIKNTITLPALSVTEPVEGVFVYDFGQNIAGICRVKVTGSAGQTITLRHGEKLNGQNMRNKDDAVGTIWTANLRDADCTDAYTLKGNPDGEVFEPSMVYHGFQYMQLTGVDTPIPIEDVEALVLSSDLETTGSFESSNQYVNQLVQNTLWSQIDNFLSVPTDCPQRDERLGWTGDAQVFARTSSYLMDVNSFMEKYMQDIRDEQSTRGIFPNGAPGWAPRTAAGGWSDAGVIIPWQMYLQYGNTSFIRDNYTAMCKYVDVMLEDTVGYIDTEGVFMDSMFGDWTALEHTPFVITETAYCAYSTRLLAKMAAVIGKTEDAEKYEAHFQNYKAAWNREFVNPDGSTKCDPATYGTDNWGNKTHPDTGEVNTQASFILGLQFDLFEENIRPLAAAKLAQSIRDGGYHIKTGFLGVSYVNPVLTSMGYSEEAFNMIEQKESPSWLYAVVNGANTIYEYWNGYQGFDNGTYQYNSSLNHYSYGSITEWLFKDVAGIQADENNPGYKHILLQPTIGGTFTYAKGSYNSIYGKIISDWSLTDDGLAYQTTIPANTTATLTLPAPDTGRQYSESGMPAAEAEGVTFCGIINGKAVYEVASGSYEFTLQSKSNVTAEIVDPETGEPITGVTTNEPFILNITTAGDVIKIKLVNENDMTIGKTLIDSIQNPDGTITWRYTVLLATAGEGRTLNILTAGTDGLYTDSGTSVTLDIVSVTPLVISAVPAKTSVDKNEEFTVTVTTTKTIDKIKLTNDVGSSIGIISKDFVINGNNKVWTITIKVGSYGSGRTFKVYGAPKGEDYLTASSDFMMDIVKP